MCDLRPDVQCSLTGETSCFTVFKIVYKDSVQWAARVCHDPNGLAVRLRSAKFFQHIKHVVSRVQTDPRTGIVSGRTPIILNSSENLVSPNKSEGPNRLGSLNRPVDSRSTHVYVFLVKQHVFTVEVVHPNPKYHHKMILYLYDSSPAILPSMQWFICRLQYLSDHIPAPTVPEAINHLHPLSQDRCF